MPLSFIKLSQLIMLHTSIVVVLCQGPGIRCTFLFFNPDGNREIVQCSLEVTHLIVAHASIMEGLREVTIFIAGLRQSLKSFLYSTFIVFILAISHDLSRFFDHLFGFQRMLAMILRWLLLLDRSSLLVFRLAHLSFIL